MIERELYKSKGLAFIDLLGFKNQVQNTMVGPIQHEAAIRDCKAVLKIVSSAKNLIASHVPETQTLMFSDTLVVIFDPKAKDVGRLIIRDLLDLVINLVFSSSTSERVATLCRGVIMEGLVYHEENILFGPAVLEAYKRERCQIKDPKVVVDQTILKAARQYKAEQTDDPLANIAKDDDNVLYLDYLGGAALKDRFRYATETVDNSYPFLAPYRKSLKRTEELLLASHDEKEVMKGEWLKKKYLASWLSQENPCASLKE
jgi:hypothetical protein